MEENAMKNATKEIEREIEEMTKTFRKKIREARAVEITEKNRKMWKSIRNIHCLITNAAFGRWLFGNRSLVRKEVDSVTAL